MPPDGGTQQGMADNFEQQATGFGGHGLKIGGINLLVEISLL